MKHSAAFCQKIVLIGAALYLTACGDAASPNRSENLPSRQNTNVAASVTPSPLVINPSPAATTIAQNSNVAPTPANVSVNVNLPVNTPVNINVNSANNTQTTATMDKLIIPVAGIKPENLRDTFKDARSEGRIHDAIDIMAAQGTPVLAAADGEIVRFFDSERGGITTYQFSRDKKFIYYYAHLQRRADGIQEHQFVKQGTVIGYVGDTGNAGAGNFHLHFAIWTVDDPKRYWNGTNINPYPLLR